MLGLSFPRGAAPQYSELLPGPYGTRRGWACWAGPGAFYCWRVSRSSSRRSSSGSLHSAESRAISWSRCRSCSTSTASRVAFSVCCTSNSATLGVFTFTSPFWTPPGWRRFAGPGPCGLGLSRMLADGRAAVKPPENLSPSPPLKGGRGELFLYKICGLFLGDLTGKRRFWGTIGGVNI